MLKYDRDFRFLVRTETEHDARLMIAEIVYPDQRDGTLLNLSGARRLDEGFAFKGLQVRMYLSGLPATTAPFGLRHGYHPGPGGIDLHDAAAMARTLWTLDRGLTRLDSQGGYIAQDDFTTYLTRVADVLRIGGIYHVQNSDRQRARTGTWTTTTDGTGLRSWVTACVHDAFPHLHDR